MRLIYDGKTTHILLVTKGEELVEEVTHYCEKENIKAAWVQGLGAGDSAEISFYDPATKTYLKKMLSEEFELISLIGNIAIVDSKPFLHAHVSLGRRDYSMIGGHLHSLRVSGSGEIKITKLSGQFTRSYDEETGLKLLDGEELAKQKNR